MKYTNVYTGTLMATLIYLQKLKSRLPKNAHGLPCTRHRILLSCLILSSKFHNDSSPKINIGLNIPMDYLMSKILI